MYFKNRKSKFWKPNLCVKFFWLRAKNLAACEVLLCYYFFAHTKRAFGKLSCPCHGTTQKISSTPSGDVGRRCCRRRWRLRRQFGRHCFRSARSLRVSHLSLTRAKKWQKLWNGQRIKLPFVWGVGLIGLRWHRSLLSTFFKKKNFKNSDFRFLKTLSGQR